MLRTPLWGNTAAEPKAIVRDMTWPTALCGRRRQALLCSKIEETLLHTEHGDLLLRVSVFESTTRSRRRPACLE